MRREPIFNVPACVLATLGLLGAIHAAIYLMAEQDAVWTMLHMAFIPARYGGEAADLPGGWVAAVTSFVTYQLVHADLTHLLVNAAWLLAFGSAVAMRVGALRFVLFSVFCGVCGALVFLVLRWGEAIPVVGASGAVSGLMAAAFRFLFAAMDENGALREEPGTAPLMSLGAMLVHRRVLSVIAVWAVINFVMAVVAPVTVSAGGIAWEVHLGGFLAGLLTFGAVDAAPQHVRDPMR